LPPRVAGGGLAQSQTTVLEVKPGPYRPNEFAEWSPEEGDAASGRFVRWGELGSEMETAPIGVMD